MELDGTKRLDFDTRSPDGKRPSVLRVRELSVRFQSGGKTFCALDRISFDLERSGSLALIGESGSGKTTAALSLLGLLPPGAIASGQVELSGVDLIAAGGARVRGAQVSMVFPDPLAALNPVMRIGTQVEEALRAGSASDRRAEVLRLLASTGLAAEVARCYPHQLSGGMRQRALIAMALACNPSLLVADEPTSALDALTREGLASLLLRLRRERGIALLLATHDLGLAARLCDRIAVLHGGRIVEEAPAADLLAHPRHPCTAGLLRSIPPRPAPGGLLPRSGAVTTPLLAAEDLCVDLGGRRVLDGLSFTLHAGETLGILGESGSGKSTLARAILRLIEPVRGAIRWNGIDLLSLRERELRPLRREMQIVFQEPAGSLDPRMTVAQILAEPLAVHRIAGRPVDLLRLVELGPELLARHPHQLSAGQAQRVALARALATRPSLLIADEAFSALDVSLQAQMVNLLRDLRRKLDIACLFITHDLRLASFLCDRLMVLSRGRLAPDGALLQAPIDQLA